MIDAIIYKGKIFDGTDPCACMVANSVFVADPAARKNTVPIVGEVPGPFKLMTFAFCCPQKKIVC